jgi:predicted nucleotidyltransferase
MNTNDDAPARPQRWDDCDEEVRAWVDAVAGVFRDELGAALVGVYLHGSLATGCYRRPKSDVDLLVVARDPLSDEVRGRIARWLLALADARPTVGYLELSVVLERHARHFVHPLPYELHFNDHLGDAVRAGTYRHPPDARDPDLTAHVTVARARGVALAGPPPAEVFGPVPWDDFVWGVLDDFAWIVEGDHVLESPFYAVLNACRVLQLLEEGEGTIANKEEGGLWALAHLPPEHRPVVEAALACYRSGAPVTPATRKTGGLAWDAAALRAFRDHAAAEARRLAPP